MFLIHFNIHIEIEDLKINQVQKFNYLDNGVTGNVKVFIGVAKNAFQKISKAVKDRNISLELNCWKYLIYMVV